MYIVNDIRNAILTLFICIFMIGNATGVYAAADMPKPVETETAPGIMAVGEDLESAAQAPVLDGGDAGMDFHEEDVGEAAFKKISGEITMIDVWNDYRFIRVMNAEGGETDFVIDEQQTVYSDLNGLSDSGVIAIGNKVDAYYVAPPFMTLQYPARFTAGVIVARDANNPGDAFVGVIDKDGRASDGSITLNISDETSIIRQSDGLTVDKFQLNNRIIIAYYAVTTRSYPPTAIVQKVVVLDKTGAPVFVNGTRLFYAEAFVKNDGTVMAPLRAIAEALGYAVDWDAEQMSARVGASIYVKIGSDEYVIGYAASIKLEAAAELINDRTYAPLSFYKTILSLTYDDSNGLINLKSD